MGSLNIYFLMEDNIDGFETAFCVHKLQRKSQGETFIVRVLCVKTVYIIIQVLFIVKHDVIDDNV